MTQETDGKAQRNALAEVTAESAAALLAEGERLQVESAQTGAKSELLRAQAEIVLAVIDRREALANAERDLARAQAELARATAALDPVQADLAQVTAELSAILPEAAGNLDARLAARQRIYALHDEYGPLQARVTELEQVVIAARETVRSWSDDQVPLAREALAQAVDALVNPPLDDMAKLLALAPATTQSRVWRVGTALVNADNYRTPHAYYVLAALQQYLASSGLLTLMREGWLNDLKRKVDPRTHALVAKAMAVEPEPVYEQFDPRSAQGIDPEALRRAQDEARLGGFPQAGSLPPVDSDEGERIRLANQQPAYRGPASWPMAGNQDMRQHLPGVG